MSAPICKINDFSNEYLIELLKNERYKDIKFIAEGAFGKFFFFLKNPSDNTKKAIKIQIINKTTNDEINVTMSILKECKNKTNILEILPLKNINNLNLLVMDYCDKGTLKKLIDCRIPLPEEVIRIIMNQILNGIYYLHDAKTFHRDMKPDNILLKSNPDKSVTLKITDFGLSKANVDYTTKTIVGTPAYSAPEIIGGRPYTNKIDIWSAGVIFYELACKHSEKSFNVYNSPAKRCLSTLPLELLRTMLIFNDNERIDAFDALNNPWFSQGYRNLTVEEIDYYSGKGIAKPKNNTTNKPFPRPTSRGNVNNNYYNNNYNYNNNNNNFLTGLYGNNMNTPQARAPQSMMPHFNNTPYPSAYPPNIRNENNMNNYSNLNMPSNQSPPFSNDNNNNNNYNNNNSNYNNNNSNYNNNNFNNNNNSYNNNNNVFPSANDFTNPGSVQDTPYSSFPVTGSSNSINSASLPSHSSSLSPKPPPFQQTSNYPSQLSSSPYHSPVDNSYKNNNSQLYSQGYSNPPPGSSDSHNALNSLNSNLPPPLSSFSSSSPSSYPLSNNPPPPFYNTGNSPSVPMAITPSYNNPSLLRDSGNVANLSNEQLKSRVDQLKKDNEKLSDENNKIKNEIKKIVDSLCTLMEQN